MFSGLWRIPVQSGSLPQPFPLVYPQVWDFLPPHAGLLSVQPNQCPAHPERSKFYHKCPSRSVQRQAENPVTAGMSSPNKHRQNKGEHCITGEALNFNKGFLTYQNSKKRTLNIIIKERRSNIIINMC